MKQEGLEKADLIVLGGHVLCSDDPGRVITDGAVAVRDGRILAVGSRETLMARYVSGETLGGPDYAVMPGLVNGHTHVPMVYFRGMADDLPLKEWLERRIWPAETEWLSEAFCRDAAALACLEMLKAGVTAFNNMYFFGDVTAEVTRTFGLRAVMGSGIIDFPSKVASTVEEYLSNAEVQIERWKGDPLILPAVAPHAAYTCGPETLKKAFHLAERHDVPLHMHLSETAWEVSEIEKRYGRQPVQYLDGLGLLGPRLSVAHAVWLTAEEIDLLRSREVSVIHCPESNLKLAAGFAPVADMVEAGLRVGFGTDGAASNNDQGIFPEMGTAARVQKALKRDPTVLPAEQAVRMATHDGARAIGLGEVTGSLETGKSADMICLHMWQPHLLPMYSLTSHLAYSASSSDVHHVVVNGRILMRDRKVLSVDEAEVLERARHWQARIFQWLARQEYA